MAQELKDVAEQLELWFTGGGVVTYAYALNSDFKHNAIRSDLNRFRGILLRKDT
jgi:hypothetical protein